LIQALTANGVRVPEDIAIAGFDNIALGNFTHPALTTIGIDHFKWGKDVAESVIKTLNQEPTPQTIHPSGHVIVRQSC
jgi:LacI family transcriptional regulator